MHCVMYTKCEYRMEINLVERIKKMKRFFYVVALTFTTITFANTAPLPEQEPPFIDSPIPPGRTLTVSYYNSSKFSYIYCTANANKGLTATWYKNGEQHVEDNTDYILLDTYNANSKGKLHLYNKSMDTPATVTCQPEFEPPLT